MLYQLSYLGTAALRRERAFIPARRGDQVIFPDLFQGCRLFRPQPWVGRVCGMPLKTIGPDPHPRSAASRKAGLPVLRVGRKWGRGAVWRCGLCPSWLFRAPVQVWQCGGENHVQVMANRARAVCHGLWVLLQRVQDSAACKQGCGAGRVSYDMA